MILRYQLLFNVILETGNSAEEQIREKKLFFPGHKYFTHGFWVLVNCLTMALHVTISHIQTQFNYYHFQAEYIISGKNISG